jgi:hypothetical protein
MVSLGSGAHGDERWLPLSPHPVCNRRFCRRGNENSIFPLAASKKSNKQKNFLPSVMVIHNSGASAAATLRTSSKGLMVTLRSLPLSAQALHPRGLKRPGCGVGEGPPPEPRAIRDMPSPSRGVFCDFESFRIFDLARLAAALGVIGNGSYGPCHWPAGSADL